MTASHYINETKSDIRGIKHGWYAVEDDGTLYSGPFSSFEECAKTIAQPTNGTLASNGHWRLKSQRSRTETRLYRHPTLKTGVTATRSNPRGSLILR
jgi:hypothetical protein